MAYKLAKTKRIPIEPGESYDPKTDPHGANVFAFEDQPKPTPGDEWRSSWWNRLNYDYPIEADRRRMAAEKAQYPEGTQFLERPGPSFRDDLAQLIGQGAADLAVDWTPAYGADWFDRMNWATESGDPKQITDTGLEGAIATGVGYLGGKLLPPAFRFALSKRGK